MCSLMVQLPPSLRKDKNMLVLQGKLVEMFVLTELTARGKKCFLLLFPTHCPIPLAQLSLCTLTCDL